MSEKFESNKPSEFENKILEFWKKNKIFEKSVNKKASKGSFVFFDGPPFATGTPHYGHILTSTIKDVVPRYWTMKGYRVKRKWGWDCHGLPIENIAEKELGIKRKKEIEELGIGKFNEFCRSKIFTYVNEWKYVIDRLGRWADMENSYSTMDVFFMESVWWVFKELWEKGLIYESYRSMYVCPRCETTLSQQEVSEGYRDIKDISVIAKFKLKPNQVIGDWISGDKTYLLAWTTTPWTLPGNTALAVGKNIEYSWSEKNGEEIIFATDSPINKKLNLGHIDKGPIKGKELIGLKYEPLFDYYFNDKTLKNRENGWKVYGADFVTVEDGVGIVHIAPAFGEDDFKLMEQYNLPFVQHVGMDGVIKSEAKDFKGMSVKPSDDHQKTDIEIIKNLASRSLLFYKEKYEHSYPHCWRCDTPLINYATSSWFVNILKIKGKAIKLAKGINWSPNHIKDGRFGKWLEGARDWSISRQRYWASALPIWRCEKCKEVKVIGSVEDIKNNIRKSGNSYFLMRHGEAESNVKNIASATVKNHNHLTDKGKRQALLSIDKLAKKLKKEKIDIIFSSDYLRTKETAEIAAKRLEIGTDKIKYDERLREVNVGIFNGKSAADYHNYFNSLEEKFSKNPPEGENLIQLKNRVSEFIYEIDRNYKDKNILIVSHEYPIWLMCAAAVGADIKKSVELRDKDDFIKTGEIKKLDFTPLPHDENYELDLHRPYIDGIEFDCNHLVSSKKVCSGKMKRVSDVLDTWFDSGSMPYAQNHYPFENKREFEENFPAEFIAEGVDQTRAWFYYLHCIATAIKNLRAFNNVIVNGIVLAEDGKKMSKRLKNYPDPMDIINKYGADALRLYLLVSPIVRAENLAFSEKGVDEVYKKTISRLLNVLSFYNLYADKREVKSFKVKSVLDKWILTRFNQLVNDVSGAMEKYELDRAVRPIFEFVDDLSTWYLRRSRRRFQKPEDKEDYLSASQVLGFVLVEFSKILAPFAPFASEVIYKDIDGRESVHLESWPEVNKSQIKNKQSQELLDNMMMVRILASLALAKRAEIGIKVRQPLRSLKVKSRKLKGKKELLEILAAEINVKEIIFDDKILSDIELDSNITSELKEEGMIREFIRLVQDLRQEAGYHPKDKIYLYIDTSEEIKLILNNHLNELAKELGVKSAEFRKDEKNAAEIQTKFEGSDLWIGIRKI